MVSYVASCLYTINSQKFFRFLLIFCVPLKSQLLGITGKLNSFVYASFNKILPKNNFENYQVQHLVLFFHSLRKLIPYFPLIDFLNIILMLQKGLKCSDADFCAKYKLHTLGGTHSPLQALCLASLFWTFGIPLTTFITLQLISQKFCSFQRPSLNLFSTQM